MEPTMPASPHVARATARRLPAILAAAALAATVLAPAGALAASTPGAAPTAVAADDTRAMMPNDPFMAFGWPYKLAGKVGETKTLYASAFSVQLGFHPVIHFSSTTPHVCAISGTTVRFLAAGDCGIHLVSTGDQFYAAGVADETYTVGTQEIVGDEGGPPLPMGAVVPLRGAATSGLPITWTAPDPWLDEEGNGTANDCTIVDGPDGPAVLAGDRPGTCVVIASQPGGNGWAAAEPRQQAFYVGPGYDASWSVTAPDHSERSDGTIQTGDVLAVTYASTAAIATCGVEVSARTARMQFPGVVAEDGRSCHFSVTIPELPDIPNQAGASACDGPFGNMISCDIRPEVCVAAELADADGQPLAMVPEDRLTPYAGHCPGVWEDGQPAQQPASMLNFLDTQPGPAAYTFASEPQVLSWDPVDWGTPDLNFGFNRLVHLELPSWVEVCRGLEIGVPPVAHWWSNPDESPCPAWDLRVPAQSASYPSQTVGYVAASYATGGGTAQVLGYLPVDLAEQDLDGEFSSTLPAFAPITPREEYLDGAAGSWEPDYRVFGSAVEPTTCTMTIDNPANPDEPIVIERDQAGGFDCHFSVPVSELRSTLDNAGCRANFNVVAAFLDGDGNPVRDELFVSSCVRPRQASLPPQVEAIHTGGQTLIGSGAADPTAVHVDVAVHPAAPETGRVAAELADCTASRSRNVTDGALEPAYVTCDLPDGGYVATSTSYNASGDSTTVDYPFVVGATDTAKPHTTPPVAVIRSGAALSGRAIPVRVTWTGADDPGGTGVARYELARSVNGGPWTRLSASLRAPRSNLTVAPSGTVRFRVRAIDVAGNTGSWTYGRVISPRLVQQSDGWVGVSGHWRIAGDPRYSGGSAIKGASAGMSTVYTFRATSVGLVTRTGPTRGKARILVSGEYRATLDLRRSSSVFRYVAFSQAWSSVHTRTLRVVVQGTSGRPTVEVDAFAVLR
jgi:hypothetical protein